jgi:uncharacterized membrane protein
MTIGESDFVDFMAMLMVQLIFLGVFLGFSFGMFFSETYWFIVAFIRY